MSNSIFTSPVSPERFKRVQQRFAHDESQRNLSNQNAEFFIFENNTHGDLYLPRRNTHLKVGEQFHGDKYYFQMVPHELKFIGEDDAMKQKLLTEQPPTVTEEGKVEFVTKDEPLNEIEKPQQTKDVLLNEAPIDGVKII